jgi:hypothetical protein
VDLAHAQVPINTIGLSSSWNVNAVELQAMVASTGGFSIVSSTEDRRYVRPHHGRAQSPVDGGSRDLPQAGTNNAVLTAAHNDQTLNQAFNFESGTDYPGHLALSRAAGWIGADAAQQALVHNCLTSEPAKAPRSIVWAKHMGPRQRVHLMTPRPSTLLVPPKP